MDCLCCLATWPLALILIHQKDIIYFRLLCNLSFYLSASLSYVLHLYLWAAVGILNDRDPVTNIELLRVAVPVRRQNERVKSRTFIIDLVVGDTPPPVLCVYTGEMSDNRITGNP